MKAFTDYPIKALGDTAGKIAPIRGAEIISYDGNKYCEVLVEDVTVEIKGGYLYHKPGRSGEVPCFMHDELSKLPLTEEMRTLLNLMNEDELKKEVKTLRKTISILKDERHRDYVRLRTKYEAAEKNLKNNPEECDGKELIEGYMTGLLDAMALLGDLQSVVCGKGEKIVEEES